MLLVIKIPDIPPPTATKVEVVLVAGAAVVIDEE
jgi:hypothetical protein